MANRTITGTLVDEAGDAIASGVMSFTLLTPLAYRESDVVLRETEEATTDESGAFSVSLAVPTLGAYLYRCRLPDGQVFNFTLEDGGTTTLSTIMASSVANSVSSASAVESLINTHDANATAHPSIRAELIALYNAYVALDYDPSGTADAAVAAHDASGTAHNDIRTALSSHEADTDNPHGVTYTQVGADAAGSAAAAQAAAIGSAAGSLASHNASPLAHGGIVASDDSRLTDARTPTAHAATHADGGADEITPAAIGAEPALGNPASSGYVLSSTAAGVRSWIAMAVSSVSLSLAQTWTALQTFSAGIVAAWVAPSANSTAAFQVRKADKTTAVLNVDTTTPKVTVTDQLTIEGATPSFSVIGAGTTAFYVKKYQDSVYSPNAGFYRARGSSSAPTAVLTGDYLGDFTWSGLRTGGYETTFATMTVQKESTSRGASLALNLANTGAPATVLKLWHDGGVSMPQLPTSDPAVAGRLWNDGGTLKISAG